MIYWLEEQEKREDKRSISYLNPELVKPHSSVFALLIYWTTKNKECVKRKIGVYYTQHTTTIAATKQDFKHSQRTIVSLL